MRTSHFRAGLQPRRISMLFFAFGMPAASSAQAPSAPIPNRQTPSSARLVQQNKRWQILLPAPPDLVSLLPVSGEKAALPSVPVVLQPGKTLFGIVTPAGQIRIALDDEDLAFLLPGTNTVTVLLPGYRSLPMTFDAAPLFAADTGFRAYASARISPVPLPEMQTVPDTAWSATSPPLKAAGEFSLPTLSGIRISLAARKLIPAGARFGQDTAAVSLSAQGRKLYFLLLAEHIGKGDMGTLTVFCTDGTILTRPLAASAFASPQGSTPNKLPRTAEFGTGTFHVIEMDLGETRSVESLLLQASGKTALGLAGVLVAGSLKPGAYASLPPSMQKLAAREPITLFAFDAPTLEGWETGGTAWGITDTRGEPFGRKGTSRWFADSKAHGEQATGSILSPSFVITGSRLTFLGNGHSAKNFYSLVDAATGAELKHSPVPEKTGAFEKITWDVTAWQGRRVRFKATDGDTRDAYAWLAFDAVTLEP